MRIVISRFERDLLLAHPETEIIAHELLSEPEGDALNGTPDQCDALREACADLLERIGFDEEYAPTIEGQALEGLIDKLLV
jgi:hypothetical protein